MEPPPIKYARHGDVHIAYQVIGDGPLDVVWIGPTITNLDILWEEPSVVRFFERVCSFSRSIIFDRRGSGLSDPIVTSIAAEDMIDDVGAVMDAAGSSRAALFSFTEGAPMSLLFAAMRPDRIGALVLYGPIAKAGPDPQLPWTGTSEDRAGRLERFASAWGTGELLAAGNPTVANDERFKRWLGRMERHSMSPGAMRRMFAMTGEVDVLDVLHTIKVPTLLLHRTEDPMVDVRHSRFLAERIPKARLVEFPGQDNLMLVGDAGPIYEEIEEFLTGTRRTSEPERVLATVMFTDIIDSTKLASELGDSRWRDLIATHDELVRRLLEQHRGREIKTMGDGFLATFDGPARAIRCASQIAASVRALGIEIRAGLHTGECEVIGDDVGGIAVNIGARVGAKAAASEVLVSSTVRDLVVGSGIAFSDRGMHELKGVPDDWRLFAVST